MPETTPSTRNVAIFGGSFNPPGLHHRQIAAHLSQFFDEVIVVPCGPRPDKPGTSDVEPIYRAAMVDMTFRTMPRVRVELFDLEGSTFTRTWQLDERYRNEGILWHVIGSDLIVGGEQGQSRIHVDWERADYIWEHCNFAVVKRPGYDIKPSDLPPHHRIFELEETLASSDIRSKIFRHQSIEGDVSEDVARYIERHGLYRGSQRGGINSLKLDKLRLMVICNELIPEAAQIAKNLGPINEVNPNLIVVIGGDGTMLRAIRQHWRRRVPFYGIRAGHVGFLLNSRPPTLHQMELNVQQLPLLWVEMENSQGDKHTALAFNDAWVERATGQTAWIHVKVNDQERLPMLMGDGALVSTAAGSTSYARAMGATPLPFNTPTLLLVGSNVLKPEYWKPVALPLSSTVELTNLDSTKRPVRGYLDGVPQGEVRTMKARVSNIAAVELAFDPHYDPAEKLAQLQFPPPGN